MTVRQFRIVPTYTEPRQHGTNSSPSWYRFDQATHDGTPPGNEIAVKPTGSPFTYLATIGGFMIIDGGNVSTIQFSRTTGKAYFTGQTFGTFPMSNGDSLIVTYSVIPVMTYVPQ